MINFWFLLFVLFAPLWTAILQATLGRLSFFKTQPPQRTALLSCFLVIFALSTATFFFEVFVPHQYDGITFFTSVFTALTTHIYFHLFNMSETARRIRILLEVVEGKTPSTRTSGNDSMLQIRLQRLLQLRQIEWREGKYFPQKSFLALVAKLIFWHETLLFPERTTIETT